VSSVFEILEASAAPQARQGSTGIVAAEISEMIRERRLINTSSAIGRLGTILCISQLARR
jgi:hypothetical protein